jgi:hypothetical protein
VATLAPARAFAAKVFGSTLAKVWIRPAGSFLFAMLAVAVGALLSLSRGNFAWLVAVAIAGSLTGLFLLRGGRREAQS